jgi:hypothetical protein
MVRPAMGFLRRLQTGPVAAGLLRLTLRLLAATWRIDIHGQRWARVVSRSPRPALAGLLHGRLGACAVPVAARSAPPSGILVSLSRDGRFIADAVAAMGMRVIQGSSGRGGAEAVLEIRRLLQREPRRVIGITIDGGHRGPRGRCKPGIAYLAAAAEAWILPMAASATRGWYARSWDRFLLPMPGSRVVLAFGKPIRLAAGNNLAEHMAQVERAVVGHQAAVDRGLGVAAPPLVADPREILRTTRR